MNLQDFHEYNSYKISVLNIIKLIPFINYEIKENASGILFALMEQNLNTFFVEKEYLFFDFVRFSAMSI